MNKIAILGKANTGKNTAANLIKELLEFEEEDCFTNYQLLAFADPIKEIVHIMFPSLKKKWLYGSSKFRNEIIPGALDSEGKPLTIRMALIEIGTKVGRGYKDSLWLDVFEHRMNKCLKKDLGVIVTDVRFRNEFDYLKKNGFFMIKICRDNNTKINHESETSQDLITDEEFDCVINNNAGLEELQNIIKNEVILKIKGV